MHPALSIIIFTTLSGVGLALLALVPIWAVGDRTDFGWIALVLGAAISVAGLVSSTFHLRHPDRAWRAFSQWRSSWLSREAVLSVATLTVFGLYGFLWLILGVHVRAIGLIGSILALATIYTTAMIYGQLRTVPAWNSGLTPACFLLFGLAGGALALVPVRAAVAMDWQGPAMFALLFTAAAWSAKYLWWQRSDTLPATSSTETATGLGRFGATRPFEAPHTGTNYLRREMGFQIARKHAAKLRKFAVAFGAAAPVALICLAFLTGAPLLVGTLALFLLLVGLLCERWLFFAEAKHVVMHYYE